MAWGMSCVALWMAALQAAAGQPSSGKVMRVEGTDAESGIHYVRMTISLGPSTGESVDPPHFTMECTETNGKRELSWFVAFGGVPVAGFAAPFRKTPEHPQRPVNPSEKLTMTFEGYQKWKPMTRVWEVLPTGELQYRNPGMHSPNMEEPRLYVAYLNSLPGLRIGYANRQPAAEVVFATRTLLDEVAKTDICAK